MEKLNLNCPGQPFTKCSHCRGCGFCYAETDVIVKDIYMAAWKSYKFPVCGTDCFEIYMELYEMKNEQPRNTDLPGSL